MIPNTQNELYAKNTRQAIVVYTMKINNNETKRKLLNTLKDGKERTLEDIIRLLIDEHKRIR